MSLFSRFRKTVTPTKPKVSSGDLKRSQRAAAAAPAGDDHHHYRKSTKSSDDKSVNASLNQNSYHSYANSDDDEQFHSRDRQTESSRSKSSSSKKPSASNMLFGTPTLSRSDTFTLEDESQAHNGRKKENGDDRGHYSNDRHNDSRNKGKQKNRRRNKKQKSNERSLFVYCPFPVNSISRDVFEPLYERRPSKSSPRSSKSSNASFRTAPDDPVEAHPQFDGGTYRKSKTKSSFLSKLMDGGSGDKNKPSKAAASNAYQPNSSIRSNRSSSSSSKPRSYIFGATFDRKDPNRREHEKENINENQKKDNDDRFKTITINNVRRSFRDSFLDSSKPSKGREHQPLWFIDVNEEKEKKPAASGKRTGGESKPVARNETFRIESKPSKYARDSATAREYEPSSTKTSLERKRSSSVDSNQSGRRSLAPVRVDFLSSGSGKSVPVGVAAPYSALNDIPERSSRSSASASERPARQSFSKLRDNSPSYAPRNLAYNASPDRGYRPNERKSATYSPARKNSLEVQESPSYVNEASDPYRPAENKFVSARQSFRDMNVGPDRSTSRPAYRIGSFRSVSDRPTISASEMANKYAKFFGDDVDEVDIGRGRAHNDKNDNLDKEIWTQQSWRNISSRPFERREEEEPENRSFVPYYKYSQGGQRDDPKPHADNNNRTTINISYNYNPSPTRGLTNNPPKRDDDQRRFDPINNSRASVGSPTPFSKPKSGKEKSGKNRSVNFPSVEYEVRLISPNYNSKPLRRKESWKSKPSSQDWTFNQVYF